MHRNKQFFRGSLGALRPCSKDQRTRPHPELQGQNVPRYGMTSPLKDKLEPMCEPCVMTLQVGPHSLNPSITAGPHPRCSDLGSWWSFKSLRSIREWSQAAKMLVIKAKGSGQSEDPRWLWLDAIMARMCRLTQLTP